MSVNYGEKTDIVELLKKYLSAAENGEFTCLAIATHTDREYIRNAILTGEADAVGLLGAIGMVRSDVEQTLLMLEATQEQQLEALTNLADPNNPQ